MSNILVTDGAGYIGSHVGKLLGRAGHTLVTLDNLSKGRRDAVLFGDLVVGDTGDRALVTRLLRDHNIDTVMHCAAFTIVPESVREPLKYYANNTCNTRNLIECCVESGIRHFVFSSTAAVYGTPQDGICGEETPVAPINPYGQSKLLSEIMLADTGHAHELRAVVLRYFNVAGCDPDGEIGQSTPESTLLVKVAVEAVLGKRDAVTIYGTDYPTPDGTGVRDYIHVTDLAMAHIDAPDYLEAGGSTITLNCGYCHGYSVREILAAVSSAAPESLKIVESERRAGDPPELIARADRIRSVLNWTPRHDDLDVIVQTSLAWERTLMERDGA